MKKIKKFLAGILAAALTVCMSYVPVCARDIGDLDKIEILLGASEELTFSSDGEVLSWSSDYADIAECSEESHEFAGDGAVINKFTVTGKSAGTAKLYGRAPLSGMVRKELEVTVLPYEDIQCQGRVFEFYISDTVNQEYRFECQDADITANLVRGGGNGLGPEYQYYKVYELTVNTLGEHTIVYTGTETEIPREYKVLIRVHSWDEGQVVKDATCTGQGEKSYTCQVCGEKKTENTEPLGHEWDVNYTVDRESTCKEQGSESRHCSRCGEKGESRLLPLSQEHTWDDGKITGDATCTDQGEKTYTCQVCQITRTEKTEALGHDWDTEYTVDQPATYTKEGSESIHCRRCNIGKEARTIPTAELPFADMKKDKEGQWYYPYIASVFEKKLMQGKSETDFGVVDNLSRAQFAVILYRMAGGDDKTGDLQPEGDIREFPDVDYGDGNCFYRYAVKWAGSVGIIQGYKDTGMFGAGDPITREQMAAMMYRYAKYKEYTLTASFDLGSFPDGSAADGNIREQLEWAVGAKLITGNQHEGSPNTLDPQGWTTRAACAAIIDRFYKNTDLF